MDLNINEELAALRRLTVRQLQARYAELFGDSTNNRNRVWLIRRILWRLQALAEGDLSDRARKRAEELANDADLRITLPRISKPRPALTEVIAAPRAFEHDDRIPPPGTFIIRKYKGQTLQVEVLPAGFSFAGKTYTSLSAVAKAITGSHCNGFHFFKCAGGKR